MAKFVETIWLNETKNVHINQILQNNKFEEVVLLTAHEPYFWLLPGMKDILCTIERNNTPCIIINSIKFESPYKFVKIESWLTYFIYWYKFLANSYNHEIFQNTFKHTYAFMVNKPEEHRCAILEILTEEKLLYYGAISWHELPTIELQQKYNRVKFVKKRLSDEFHFNKNYKLLPKEYFDSFVILIAETSYNDFFMTEKTLVAIEHEKLFLVASCVNFYKRMQELGFLLYDEVFDYSFDTEPDMYLRMKSVVNNLKKLSKLSPSAQTELHLKTNEKRLYNKALLDKLVVNKEFIPKIVLDLLLTEHKTQFSKDWIDQLCKR